MRLAERLRALRRARSWSLDELSALSGVSRASLSRIENGEVSPTASVLGRLAGAHRTTVSRLLADIEGDAPALVRRSEQREWVDPATGFRRRLVSPPAVGFDCELLSCELPVGARIDYPLPPRLGLEHHLYLMDGALELTIEDTAPSPARRRLPSLQADGPEPFLRDRAARGALHSRSPVRSWKPRP